MMEACFGGTAPIGSQLRDQSRTIQVAEPPLETEEALQGVPMQMSAFEVVPTEWTTA